MSKRSLYELPGYAERGGYVYALLYSTGIVQVGRTADARSEVSERRRTARALGIDLAGWWVSKAHAEWIASERQLSEAARTAGRRTGTGCYAGIDFASLTETAEAMEITSTGAWAFSRRYRRREAPGSRDRRMAVAVRQRAEGMSVREIARRESVSHTTIQNDLARWERVKDSMPLEILRLTRPAGNRTWQPDLDPPSSAETCLPPEIATVTPFRRMA